MADLIDAHHHLWSYSAEEYPWIPEKTPLARDRLLPELDEAMRPCGVTGTVVVQARQTRAESHALVDLGQKSDLIQGIVGWVPLSEYENLAPFLDELRELPKFRGLRHVLEGEDDDYFHRDDFHCGLAQLPTHGLSYDLLILQRQIPAALKLLDRQPKLDTILDHLAKPEIEIGKVNPEWKKGMRELARREQVSGVKFSGLATEFPVGSEIDPATLRAYFHETLAIFGPGRVMYGSDWPVCLLRLDSYRDWQEKIRELIAELSPDEQALFTHQNAERCYRLGSVA